MTGRRMQALSSGTVASMLQTPAGQSRGACSPAAPGPRAPGRGRATACSGRCGVAKNCLPLRRLRTSFPAWQTIPSQGSLRRLARRGGERNAPMCSLRIQCMFVTGSVFRSGLSRFRSSAKFSNNSTTAYFRNRRSVFLGLTSAQQGCAELQQAAAMQ